MSHAEIRKIHIMAMLPSNATCKAQSLYNTIPGIQSKNITKRRLYNFAPLKPHFYIVKLGFTGVYIIFLILLKNIDCGYLQRQFQCVPTIYVLSRNIKNIRIFYLKIFLFWLKKISVYLNRRVFLMTVLADQTWSSQTKMNRLHRKIVFLHNLLVYNFVWLQLSTQKCLDNI